MKAGRRAGVRVYLNAAGEDDHLLGLHILQPVHARNPVANREHAARLANVDVGGGAQNLLLDDGGHFGGRCHPLVS